MKRVGFVFKVLEEEVEQWKSAMNPFGLNF